MQKAEKQDRLTSALRAVADDDQSTGASPAVEARLLAEVRSIARARRHTATVTWCALAMTIALVVGLSVWLVMRPGTAPVTTLASREVATEFFPLRYSGVPAAATHIVRMDVPRTALASFGLASFDDISISRSGTVVVDVVVGDDGLARAVRFVRR